MEKYKDGLNWYWISQSQELSEDFIEKHSGELDWSAISSYQKLSGSFIEKHFDELYFPFLVYNDKLEEEARLKLYDL
jgi:hypothetical protein